MPNCQSVALTVAHRFERVVEQYPDRIAIGSPSARVSYKELNSRANRLARYLSSFGIRQRSPVALEVGRGIEQVVTILAILKAGCAYLPLDPAAPISRKEYMLSDSGCQLVVTSGARDAESLARDRTHVDLETLSNDELSSDASNLSTGSADDLAYVLFTSGSTGSPKGVLIENQAVLSFVDGFSAFYEDFEVRRVSQGFSAAFDASVAEIFFALLTGKELFIGDLDPTSAVPDDLLDHLEKFGVDWFLTTPTFLLRAHCRKRSRLRTITVCGEICPPELARTWSTQHRFVNAYGPTETVCGVTAAEVDGSITPVPIGRPLDHVEVLILADGEQVPDGTVGEIWIAGQSVARGYQNLPQLTAERFQNSDAHRCSGERMYRTGDLGQMRPDGLIEFCGREDDQVKVRGYRIELGEVESRIRSINGVNDSVVVPFGDQASRELAAFILADEELDIERVRRTLTASLPGYMVPERWERLEEIPVLVSGKTDRSRLSSRADDASQKPLAEPDGGRPDPVDVMESTGRIWADVLDGKQVSASDNFFLVGGSSVLALRVVAAVRERFRVNIPVGALFENPNLSDFVKAIEAAANPAVPPTSAQDLADDLSRLNVSGD